MKIRNLGFSKEDFKLVKNYMGMIILGFLIVVQCIYLRAEQKFVLATTLDFTGWGWWDEKDRHPDYYPLEILETRIKELAEVGIGKIYLRVSVRGLSLYPSKVTKQYGEDDLFHWQDPQRSRRLIATLQKYDPCREIIRLGHKYGMQVWAWESIFEDGGLDFFIPKDEKYMKLADDAEDSDARTQVVADMFYAVKTVLILLHPIVPNSCELVRERMGLPEDIWSWETILDPMPHVNINPIPPRFDFFQRG